MSLRITIRQAGVLTIASLKARYRSTFTGFLWVLLSPIFMFGAQSFAFHYILKIDISNYPLFLMTGLIPWIFMSTSLDMSSGAYVNYGRMLKSFPIHPFALLFSQIADNFVNYCAAFLVILVPVAWYTHWSSANWLLLLPAFASLLIFVVGLTNLIATLNVFFRDTRFIMSFVLQVAFFMTPIFYPRELIPSNLRWVVWANPFAVILWPFQSLATGVPFREYLVNLAFSYGLSFFTLLASALYWRRKRNALYFAI